MTDTVLQSFCERCGTRYTFTEPQESKPDGGRGKLGLFGRRSAETAEAGPSVSTTLPSSERFRGTFHFCLECRQYTCANCWNDDAGACVGCRPPGEAPEPTRARSEGTDFRATRSGGSSWSAGTASTARSRDTAAPWAEDRSPATGSDVAATDEPVSELDEWGRPRASTPAVTESTAPEETPAAAPAVDPWRGVVFSGEKETAAPSALPLRETADGTIDFGAADAPATDSVPPSDPVAPTPRAKSPARPPMPTTDDSNDERSANRLQEMTSGIDASSWARAAAASSAARVASDTTTREAQASEDSEPEITKTDAVIPDPDATDTAVTEAELPDPDATDTAATDDAVTDDAVAGDVATNDAVTDDAAADSEPGTQAEERADGEDPASGAVGPVAIDDDEYASGTAHSEPSATDASQESPDQEAPSMLQAPESSSGRGPASPPPTEPARDVLADLESRYEATDGDDAHAEPTPEPEPVAHAEPTPEPEPVEPHTPMFSFAEPESSEAESPPDLGSVPTAAPDLEPTASDGESGNRTAASPEEAGAAYTEPVAPLPEAAPPPALAPIPAPSIEVWNTPAQQGPFAQPYAPPPPMVPRPPTVPPAPIPPPPPAAILESPSGPPMQGPGPTPPSAAQAYPSASPPAPSSTPGRAGTRACPNCALPLSAKARFCRRCGAPQG